VHRDGPALQGDRDYRAGERLGDVGQGAVAHDGQRGRLTGAAGDPLQHRARRPGHGVPAGLPGEVDEAEAEGVPARVAVEADQPLLLEGREDPPRGGAVETDGLGEGGGRGVGSARRRHGPQEGRSALDRLHVLRLVRGLRCALHNLLRMAH
jgi:hypothetical protein